MNDTSSEDREKLAGILGSGHSAGRIARLRWKVIAGSAVLLAIAIGGLMLRSGNGTDAPRYQTEAVRRGDLTVTVSATGTLQPTNAVEVGSELSGIVETVLVDDNDRVKKGQVLARLDVSKLRDEITKSRAALASAKATVRQTEATVRESRANLDRLRKVLELSGGKVPSQTELETAEAKLARAVADQAVAQASVAEAEAALSSNETNLAKASIRSPIDGVVLSRKIEPGQTVAASLSAPVLFNLAEDLARMELQVNVDEADVGQVRDGQSATFTVDAYPARRYPALITRVGLGSTTTDNVVSYKTILEVDNDDLSLRPGMTATAEITTARRENALLVPNAALRFEPSTGADSAAPKQDGGIVSKLLPRMPAQTQTRKNSAEGADRNAQRVWVLRNGEPAAVTLSVGVSDGKYTEVTGGLDAGAEVIVDSQTVSR